MNFTLTKVSSKSNPKSVAGFITNKINSGQPVEIIVVGASAVNQAMKAIAIAKQYLDKEVSCNPSFEVVNINDRQVTGIKLTVS